MDGSFSNNTLGLGAAMLAWKDIADGNVDGRDQDENSQQGNGHLSEAEKEHIIFKCKDAKTEEEKDKILDSLSPEDLDSLGDVVRGPGIG